MTATAPALVTASAPATATASALAPASVTDSVTAWAPAPAPAPAADPVPALAMASAPDSLLFQDFQKELEMEPGAELATYTAAAKETLPDMGMVVDGIKGDSSKELGKT